MKKFSLRLVLPTLALSLATFSFSAYAQAPIAPGGGGGIGQGIVEAINKLRESLVDWLNSARDTLLDKLYEENASYPATVTGNTTLAEYAATLKDMINEKIMPEIKEELTQVNRSSNQRVLSAIPASDSFEKSTTSGVASLFGGNEKEKKPPSGDNNFNAGSLLAGTVYDEQEERAANRYLEFLSEATLPLTSINISDLTDAQKAKIDTVPAGREWRLTVRGRLAQYTMAKDNLLRLYNERISQPELGEKAGIPELKNASLLQLEEYLATRRVKDKSWYAIMAESPPATLLRELVYENAELNHHIFQLRMENQRIVALLSVLVLQNIQANKQLGAGVEQQLKAQLNAVR